MTGKRHQRRPLVIIATLSTAIGFGVTFVQGRALGDEPVIMLLCGCLMAAVAVAYRLGNPILLGLASMAAFPICALVDLCLHGGHNLLPIEFGFYLAYGAIGVFVATGVRCLRVLRRTE